jgi:hypothetical protein
MPYGLGARQEDIEAGNKIGREDIVYILNYSFIDT